MNKNTSSTEHPYNVDVLHAYNAEAYEWAARAERDGDGGGAQPARRQRRRARQDRPARWGGAFQVTHTYLEWYNMELLKLLSTWLPLRK